MRKERPTQPISQHTDPQDQEGEMPHKPSAVDRVEKSSKQRRRQRKNNPLGAGLAVVAGRTAGALSRRLHLGGGTSIAGLVAQRLYPPIVEHLATQLEHGSVLVTGTNGKTTTSSFIAAILGDAGLRVWRNREGANLMGGIASTLVMRALPSGQLRRSGRAISILEIDEAALTQIIQSIPPRILVFTNLFRDQLDRYGEVDTIIKRWQQAISALPESTTLILNADDPAIASLGTFFAGKVLYYGIEDPTQGIPNQDRASEEHHQVLDTRSCPQCGKEYVYDIQFYSHMGHYRCPQCQTGRPYPDVQARQIRIDSFDRLRMQVHYDNKDHEVVIPLPGLYNLYNALAAITVTRALEINWEPIISGIEQFKPVFGRGERIQAEGRTLRLLLAKNPTGFNEVLRTLFSNEEKRFVLFVLNDHIADGRDISWIWDVDFERICGQTQSLTVSGTRALDLALRLKYAGVDQEKITIIPSAPLRATLRDDAGTRRARRMKKRQQASSEGDSNVEESSPSSRHLYGLKKAIDTALSQTPIGETLFIVPTYTGLLEVHRELEQRGLTSHYWEGKDS